MLSYDWFQKDQWKYKCKDCEYTSIQSSTMKSHLRKYHPNSYKAIQCESCSFVSLNVDVLNRHRHSHKFETLTATGKLIDLDVFGSV